MPKGGGREQYRARCPTGLPTGLFQTKFTTFWLIEFLFCWSVQMWNLACPGFVFLQLILYTIIWEILPYKMETSHTVMVVVEAWTGDCDVWQRWWRWRQGLVAVMVWHRWWDGGRDWWLWWCGMMEAMTGGVLGNFGSGMEERSDNSDNIVAVLMWWRQTCNCDDRVESESWGGLVIGR